MTRKCHKSQARRAHRAAGTSVGEMDKLKVYIPTDISGPVETGGMSYLYEVRLFLPIRHFCPLTSVYADLTTFPSMCSASSLGQGVL